MTPEMSPPKDPKPPRRRIWLRALLFVSLAFNLAVLGLAFGAYLNLRQAEGDRPERMSREFGLGPFLYALDEQGRAELQAAAMARKGELRARRVEWRQAFRETLAVLRAESFDAQRFRDLVLLQADLAAEGRRMGQEIVAEQIATMSLEQRRGFADRLERELHFGGRERGHPHGPPPEDQDRR